MLSHIGQEIGEDKTVEITQGTVDSGTTTVDSETGVESTGPKRLTDTISMAQVNEADHPLDPLMTMADRALKQVDEKYFDYSSKMLTQVRTGNTLHDENLMFLKVRHSRDAEDGEAESKIPFSIYTKFLKPQGKAGQEAIWVDGKDEGLILGHGTGFLNIKTVRLPPEGSFAMSGNRYPIYQIGFRNLIIKMKEFGENDRKYDECDVKIQRNVSVDDRSCTLLTITHPVKRDHFEYHIAKIYIDDEYEVPTGYEGFLWPEEEGGEPILLEKYFYVDLELNCGLKEIDFEISNPEYDYPAW